MEKINPQQPEISSNEENPTAESSHSSALLEEISLGTSRLLGGEKTKDQESLNQESIDKETETSLLGEERRKYQESHEELVDEAETSLLGGETRKDQESHEELVDEEENSLAGDERRNYQESHEELVDEEETSLFGEEKRKDKESHEELVDEVNSEQPETSNKDDPIAEASHAQIKEASLGDVHADQKSYKGEKLHEREQNDQKSYEELNKTLENISDAEKIDVKLEPESEVDSATSDRTPEEDPDFLQRLITAEFNPPSLSGSDTSTAAWRKEVAEIFEEAHRLFNCNMESLDIFWKTTNQIKSVLPNFPNKSLKIMSDTGSYTVHGIMELNRILLDIKQDEFPALRILERMKASILDICRKTSKHYNELDMHYADVILRLSSEKHSIDDSEVKQLEEDIKQCRDTLASIIGNLDKISSSVEGLRFDSDTDSDENVAKSKGVPVEEFDQNYDRIQRYEETQKETEDPKQIEEEDSGNKLTLVDRQTAELAERYRCYSRVIDGSRRSSETVEGTRREVTDIEMIDERNRFFDTETVGHQYAERYHGYSERWGRSQEATQTAEERNREFATERTRLLRRQNTERPIAERAERNRGFTRTQILLIVLFAGFFLVVVLFILVLLFIFIKISSYKPNTITFP